MVGTGVTGGSVRVGTGVSAVPNGRTLARSVARRGAGRSRADFRSRRDRRSARSPGPSRPRDSPSSSPPLSCFPIPRQRASRGRRVSPDRGNNGLDEALRAPLDAELARRRHVAEERGCRDDGRAREVAQTSHAHAVGPIAIERSDRALAFPERVWSLTKAGSAPRLAYLRTGRAEDVGDRLATKSRVGLLDVALHAARPREDDELSRRTRCPLRTRRLQNQRRLK